MGRTVYISSRKHFSRFENFQPLWALVVFHHRRNFRREWHILDRKKKSPIDMKFFKTFFVNYKFFFWAGGGGTPATLFNKKPKAILCLRLRRGMSLKIDRTTRRGFSCVFHTHIRKSLTAPRIFRNYRTNPRVIRGSIMYHRRSYNEKYVTYIFFFFFYRFENFYII